jgi:hypothetical protein
MSALIATDWLAECTLNFASSLSLRRTFNHVVRGILG